MTAQLEYIAATFICWMFIGLEREARYDAADSVKNISGIEYINGGIILGEIIHRFSNSGKLPIFAGLNLSVY